MDKETLSNYGWIVICILVMVVMIALATPFGDFIASAIKSTSQGLFDTSQNALDSLGNLTKSPEWLARNHGDVIPDGGEYVISTTGQVLRGGDKFPAYAENDDVYTYGHYRYMFDAEHNGWSARVIDTSLDMYDAVLLTINKKPITVMDGTFMGCTALVSAPEIPETVVSIVNVFRDCALITAAPALPDGITNMDGAFYGCAINDAGLPVIGENVRSMNYAFYGCDFIAAPAIPEGVVDLEQTFAYCTKLTTAPVIPTTAFNMNGTFEGCNSLTGTVRVPCSALINSTTIPSQCILETFHTDACYE